MKRETIIWVVVMLIGAALLGARATMTEHGMGRQYVEAVAVNPDLPDPAHR